MAKKKAPAKTILNLISDKYPDLMPKKIYDGGVIAPTSFDDLAVIFVWFKRTESSKMIQLRVTITDFEVVRKW